MYRCLLSKGASLRVKPALHTGVDWDSVVRACALPPTRATQVFHQTVQFVSLYLSAVVLLLAASSGQEVC